MLRLDGNNILLIDPEPTLLFEMGDKIEGLGASATVACSFAEARDHLIRQDFDLIICSHELGDGNIFELSRWAESNLLPKPRFVCLKPNGLEIVIPEWCKFEGVLNKDDSAGILKSISGYLFNSQDFINCLENGSKEGVVHYSLLLKGRVIDFDPLELNSSGIFFDVNEEVVLHHNCFLRIFFMDRVSTKTFTLSGMIDQVGSKGSYFRVNDEYKVIWKNVIEKITEKQSVVSGFLKKAAGL
jgi:hypothetical protein